MTWIGYTTAKKGKKSNTTSITEPRARFLLFLFEHLTIDFPSHFILSIIDVYRDTVTRDKLIFPSAIMWILRHFSVPFPSFDHFSVICVIDYATIKWSEAQFWSRQSGTAAPPTPSTPSTFAPSTSAGGVTLDTIIVQFQRMDARLDTLSTKLYEIYYLCFTQKYLDEFCFKCFRNTGCQSLLALNSLLAKIFKSLC